MNERRTIRFAQGLSAAAVLVVLAPPFLSGQIRIRGQLVNGTVAKPAPNQLVQLLQPRGGMQQVATAVTDSAGHFLLAQPDLDPRSFYVLQAVFQGVNYHAPVKFDPNGDATVDLTVYESTRTPPALRIDRAQIVVQAEGNKAHVREMFAVRNSSDPPRSYADPDGTFSFRLASAAGEPTLAVVGLMNMPLPQVVNPGKSPGEFSIQYPLKPGLTVVMLTYDADYTSGRLRLGDVVPYPIASAELLVSPSSLAVDSNLFKAAGTDPETGGQKYAANKLERGIALEARVSGEAASGGESQTMQSETEVKAIPNHLARQGVPVLLCFLLVLFWALGIRVAKEWPRWREGRRSSATTQGLAAKVESLLNSLADLDELYAAGKMAEKQYWKERLELKARVVTTLKKAPPSLLESYATRHTVR